MPHTCSQNFLPNFAGLAPAKPPGDAGLIDPIATIPFQHADLHAKDIPGHVFPKGAWASRLFLPKQTARMAVPPMNSENKGKLARLSCAGCCGGNPVHPGNPADSFDDPGPGDPADGSLRTMSWGFRRAFAPKVKVRPPTWRTIVNVPLRFERPGGEWLWIAGIWESRGDCFSMITTEPNTVLEPVHDRMPAVLGEDQMVRYLAGELSAFGPSAVALHYQEAANFLKSGKAPEPPPAQGELF